MSLPDELPKGPSRDEKGLFMKVENAEFRTHDQLSKLNRDRLSKKGLKPIESVTFADIRVCNRDHLRTYCAVYEMKRKEKDQMERDVARCVAAWHFGEPGYDIADYKPASRAASIMSPAAATPSVPRSSRTTTHSEGDSHRKRATLAPPESGLSLLTTAAARPEPRTIKRARISTPPTTPSGAGRSAPAGSSSVPAMAQSLGSTGFPGPSYGKPGITGVDGPSLHPAPPRMVAVPPPQVSLPMPSAAGGSAPLPQSSQLSAPIGSFKHYAHAKQAEQRYKMAYNGGGAAIVQVVENAAAYFEGRDTTDVKLNKKVSHDRYQFNVDMLNEIFDGPPLVFEARATEPIPSSAAVGTATGRDADGDAVMAGVTPAKPAESDTRRSGRPLPSETDGDTRRKALVNGVMRRLAANMKGRGDAERLAELSSMDEAYRRLTKSSELVEQVPLRSFQILSKARTVEEIDAARQRFEAEQNVKFVEGPPSVVKRTLDPNAALFSPATKLRIVKLSDL